MRNEKIKAHFSLKNNRHKNECIIVLNNDYYDGCTKSI